VVEIGLACRCDFSGRARRKYRRCGGWNKQDLILVGGLAEIGERLQAQVAVLGFWQVNSAGP